MICDGCTACNCADWWQPSHLIESLYVRWSKRSTLGMWPGIDRVRETVFLWRRIVRTSIRHLAWAGLLCGTVTFALAEEPAAAPVVAESDADVKTADLSVVEPDATEQQPVVQQVRLRQPQPIGPVPQPVLPAVRTPSSARRLSTVFSATGPSLLSELRRTRSSGPTSLIVGGSESRFRATTDAGNLLGKSVRARGVTAQNRTPIITDTRVRGSGVGSLLASGSYWVPARQDLDTMLSKIDSRIVSDAIIIPGPYSAVYGPGTQFVDIDLLASPRYANGFESHGISSVEYKTNGEQWYGRQTILAGDDNWGVRIGYGHRTGNDYEMGNGQELPTSYKSRDIDGVRSG